MNKGSKVKLLNLNARCEATLKGDRQYIDLWRGEMRAIVAAVHELKKAGKLE